VIATPRDQLQAERKANEKNRSIIAALTQRIPAIEAPEEVPESTPRPDRATTYQPPRRGSGGHTEALVA
jgi:hypothetical protein